jgi:hypothetical protein
MMMSAVRSSHDDVGVQRELRMILLNCFHDITFINRTRRGDCYSPRIYSEAH